jgi:hypothetical protein
MKCSKCGGETKFVEKSAAESKNGKKWAGYFCQDKECKNVDWVKDTKMAKAYQKQEADGISDKQWKMLCEINRKIDILVNDENGITKESLEVKHWDASE